MEFEGAVQWATLFFLLAVVGGVAVFVWMAGAKLNEIMEKIGDVKSEVGDVKSDLDKAKDALDARISTAVVGLDGRITNGMTELNGKVTNGLLSLELTLTKKIDDSRHFLRNEIQSKIGKIDEELNQLTLRTIEHVENDGRSFRELGEAIARIEGHTGIPAFNARKQEGKH